MLILNHNYKKVCDIMKCPNCGYEINETDNFCQNCGNAISKNQPQTSPKAVTNHHNKILVILSVIVVIFIGLLVYLLLNYDSETSSFNGPGPAILQYTTIFSIPIIPIVFGLTCVFIIDNNKLKRRNKIWILILVVTIFVIIYMTIMYFSIKCFIDILKALAATG